MRTVLIIFDLCDFDSSPIKGEELFLIRHLSSYITRDKYPLENEPHKSAGIPHKVNKRAEMGYARRARRIAHAHRRLDDREAVPASFCQYLHLELKTVRPYLQKEAFGEWINPEATL